MTDSIERTLELNAAPERVWRALSEPSELASWFPDRAELELRPGAEGWFEWEAHGRYAVRVEAVEPPRRFSWRWARDPGTSLDDGPTTLVEWELLPREGGGTILKLRESGFVRDEDRQANLKGWRAELGELEELLAA